MQKKIILVFPMLCLFFIYLELSPTKIKKIKYFDKETEITVMDNRLKVPKAIYNIQTDPFSGTPEQIANQYLKKNFIKHKLKSDLSDLNLIKVKKSLSGSQVIFSQSYQNIPVIGGNVLLNLNKRKCVTALISGYKPDICINTTPSVSYLTAEQSLRDNLNIDKSESGLLKKSNLNIYLGDDNEYHLIWRVVLKIKNPSNEIWYAYIDASDGQLLKKIQANQYALNCGADKQMATTTSGQVCDPDPETAEVSTLAQSYVYRDIKDVEVFTATPDYPNDYDKWYYQLRGKYAWAVNWQCVDDPTYNDGPCDCYDEDPGDLIGQNIDGVISQSAADMQGDLPDEPFVFIGNEDAFRMTNVYYHIDTFRRYLYSIGWTDPIEWKFAEGLIHEEEPSEAIRFRVDQTQDSEFDQFMCRLNLRGKTAEDQSGIIHEYGHALMDALISDPNRTKYLSAPAQIMSEGASDYFGVSYRRSIPNIPTNHATWNNVFNWDSIEGRTIGDQTYPEDWDPYALHQINGLIWASTLISLEYNDPTDETDTSERLGREITNNLILESYSYIPNGEEATIYDFIYGIFQADIDLYDGDHLDDIGQIFYERGWTKLPSQINSDMTINGIWICDGTIDINYGNTLTIEDGTIIYMKPNVNIYVYGHINADASTYQNPIRFTQYTSGQHWGTINLLSGGNYFHHCVFDGGNSNVVSASHNNEFSHCNFKNASSYGFYAVQMFETSSTKSDFSMNNCEFSNNAYGIYAKYTYGDMVDCTLRNNTYDGLCIEQAYIGYNTGTYPGLFRYNLIENNGRYGVQIKTNGKLYLGYGSLAGNNRIRNNGSSGYAEIAITSSSSGSRLYQSSTGGYSDIYDDYLGYYVYNLAQTYNGEYYVSLTQLAENNYWKTSSAPPSERFYNSVDRNPYKTTWQGAGAGADYVPAKIGIVNSDQTTQYIFSVNELDDKNLFPSDTTEEITLIKDRMTDLRTSIQDNPQSLHTPSILKELYGLLMNDDPENKCGQKQAIIELLDEKLKFWEKMEPILANKQIRNSLSIPDSVCLAYQLTGEVAMLAEVDMKINIGLCDEALSLIEIYNPYIKNGDNRILLMEYKLSIYEQQSKYMEALNTIAVLEEMVKESEIPGYIAPTYEINKHDILIKLGKDPNDVIFNKLIVDKDSKYTDLPNKFLLNQNYPNPFNPTTTIPFQLPKASHVKIVIYNTLGRKVTELTDQDYQAGYHTVTFDGNGLASGIYFIRAQMVSKEKDNQNFVFNKKMILIK